MDEAVRTEYLRQRKQGTPAKFALRGAKAVSKPTVLEWDTFAGNHFAVGTTEQDGFTIRVDVDYDQYASPTIGVTDTDTGIRNPEYARKWDGDSWSVRNVGKYIQLESGETVKQLAEYYHRDDGMARNVAWETARQSLAEEAAGYMGEDYVQLIVTAYAFVNGKKVGTGQVGTDLIIDYRNLERDLDDVAVDVISEATFDAREHLPASIEEARQTLNALEQIVQIGA